MAQLYLSAVARDAAPSYALHHCYKTLRIPCAGSNLRYNPRHYAKAKNEGSQAGPIEATQKAGVWRKTAQRRRHIDRDFAVARRPGTLAGSRASCLNWPIKKRTGLPH